MPSHAHFNVYTQGSTPRLVGRIAVPLTDMGNRFHIARTTFVCRSDAPILERCDPKGIPIYQHPKELV